MEYTAVSKIKFPAGETGQWVIEATENGWSGEWSGPGRIVLVHGDGTEESVTLGEGETAVVTVTGSTVIVSPT